MKKKTLVSYILKFSYMPVIKVNKKLMKFSIKHEPV